MTFTRKIAGLGASAVLIGALAGAAMSPVFAADAAKPAPVYREFVQGNPKAKVVVIEYASLTCPHCAHF